MRKLRKLQLIALFVVLFCGGAMSAQETSIENRPATVSILSFGDVTGPQGHDRQLVWQYTASGGFTVIQQNKQSADSATANGNINLGWKWFFGRKFDVVAAAGPVFNYQNSKKLGGYNDQVNAFLTANWRTRWFEVLSLNKLLFPTDKKVFFADRHIQTIRGPTGRTPRWLRGVALDLEESRVNGPGGGHWLEFEVGPLLNPAQMLGKPKSIWSHFSAYVYRDFCRPQPGHGRTWDIRIQYQQTFSFAH